MRYLTILLSLPVAAVFAVCLSVPLVDVHWSFDLLAQMLPPACVMARWTALWPL